MQCNPSTESLEGDRQVITLNARPAEHGEQGQGDKWHYLKGIGSLTMPVVAENTSASSEPVGYH